MVIGKLANHKLLYLVYILYGFNSKIIKSKISILALQIYIPFWVSYPKSGYYIIFGVFVPICLYAYCLFNCFQCMINIILKILKGYIAADITIDININNL